MARLREDYALIVGINEFEDEESFPKLQRAESDALSFADALLKSGWDESSIHLMIGGNVNSEWAAKRLVLTTGQNVTKESVTRELTRISNLHYSETSFMVFYYAGHGFLEGGVGYLAVPKTRIDNPHTGLEMKIVFDDFVLRAQGGRILAILDCCHSGAILTQPYRATLTPIEGIKENTKRLLGTDNVQKLRGDNEISERQRFIITSCRARQIVSDVDDKSSLTRRLVEAWNGGIDGKATSKYEEVTISSIQEYLWREIPRNGQSPIVWGAAPSENFIINSRPQSFSQTMSSNITLADVLPIEYTSVFSSFNFTCQKIGKVYTLTPQFIRIEGGEFLMGSNKDEILKLANSENYFNEFSDATGSKRHSVFVPEFEIARFPVTVAEYKLFLEQSLVEHIPLHWESQLKFLSRPVIGVSCNDATAFCEWISTMTNQSIALPTEEQWEKAARWGPGWNIATNLPRIYCWSDNKYDRRYCKLAKTDIVPIGGYSQYASAYGVEDLIGNIKEWTCSILTVYGSNIEGDISKRVIRGTSYIDGKEDNARSACRLEMDLRKKEEGVGFRLVRLSSVRG